MRAAVEVKVCGVCSAEDARVAAGAGAAFVGVILAPGRTRSQTIADAAVIFDGVSVGRVGVFVDAPAGVVIAAARELGLAAVQLHGDESPRLVRRIRDGVGCEVWKALRVRDGAAFVRDAGAYAPGVDALLLDGWTPGVHGGAGVRFDWEGVAAAGLPADTRIIVAGGLTPENVAQAVSLLRPSVVDVSSGVEREPGRKSSERIHAFMAATRGVRMR
jgi:phosphoribosylanthranilate isomerase